MAMEDEYDPFDVGGRDYVPDTPGYQASKGTAASTLGYTSDQVYGGGGSDGDDNNRFIARPGAGLTKTQFEKTYGITDRNPFGRRPSGFAAFLDKFSRSLGGKGVDYSQQFRDLDRFMGRDPGESAARFRQRQYDLYRKPDIAADGRITSGGIDRAGRGTFQGPVEEINREMGTGEQLLRAGLGSIPFAGPFLSGLGGDGDLYLSSSITPEMREIRNQSLGSQLIENLNLSDTIGSARDKVEKGLTSLGDRLQGIFTGQGQQSAQAVIPSRPAMGSRDPSREIGPLAQSIPLNQELLQGPPQFIETDRRSGIRTFDPSAPNVPVEAISGTLDFPGTAFDRDVDNILVAEGTTISPSQFQKTQNFERDRLNNLMPVESDPRLSDNTTAEMLRESRVVDVPTPIGRRFDSPVTEIDTVSGPLDRYTIDTQTGRPMDEIDTISFQSLFPQGELDSIAAKPPELVNAPNVGFERDLGPTTPDDLRAIGIEPSVQDLIDMGLSPAEILQENLKRSEPQASTGQAQVAQFDYPELSKISEIARQLATGQGLGGSTKIFGGDLGVTFSPDDRGIGFQFRKELQDKDMGARELLSILNRIGS